MMLINSHKTAHMAEVAIHERKQTSNHSSLFVSQEHYATLINDQTMC